MGKRGWAITPADRSGRGAVDAATEEEVATEWRSRFARLGVLRMEQWGSITSAERIPSSSIFQHKLASPCQRRASPLELHPPPQPSREDTAQPAAR